jgi:hypothetical protein
VLSSVPAGYAVALCVLMARIGYRPGTTGSDRFQSGEIIWQHIGLRTASINVEKISTASQAFVFPNQQKRPEIRGVFVGARPC